MDKFETEMTAAWEHCERASDHLADAQRPTLTEMALYSSIMLDMLEMLWSIGKQLDAMGNMLLNQHLGTTYQNDLEGALINLEVATNTLEGPKHLYSNALSGIHALGQEKEEGEKVNRVVKAWRSLQLRLLRRWYPEWDIQRAGGDTWKIIRPPISRVTFGNAWQVAKTLRTFDRSFTDGVFVPWVKDGNSHEVEPKSPETKGEPKGPEVK